MYVYALYRRDNDYTEIHPVYLKEALYRPRSSGLLFESTSHTQAGFCKSLLKTTYADHFTSLSTHAGSRKEVRGCAFVVDETKNRVCFMIPDEQNQEFVTFLHKNKDAIFNILYYSVHPWVQREAEKLRVESAGALPVVEGFNDEPEVKCCCGRCMRADTD